MQAPSLLLEDYNYFINKAINQYINKIYNSYEVNQQKSDDLRVLKGTTVLIPTKQDDYGTIEVGKSLMGSTYETYLPDDYLHILNCITEFKVDRAFKCYDKDDLVHFGAKKLTSDMYSQIINNYYMRPSYKSPYFFINNVNTQDSFPTASTSEANQIPGVFINYELIGTAVANNTVTINGLTFTFKTTPSPTNKTEVKVATAGETSMSNLYYAIKSVSDSKLNGIDIKYIASPDKLYIKYGNSNVNIIAPTKTGDNLTLTGPVATTENTDPNRVGAARYGNKSKVRMEIRYGKDSSLFELQKVYVDYLKAPQFVRLTQTQVDTVEDQSQLLEFPDYVCQEIVNELIHLLMENGSDPRLQSHIPINQSIAQPQGEQQPQKR